MLPPSAQALTRSLTRLPGVGQRSAQRHTVHLLRTREEDALELAHAIINARKNIKPCPECYGFAEHQHCPICSDTRRDDTLLCIVESPQDIEPIERTNTYNGKYLVLGGALSPLDGINPEDLRLAELRHIAEQNPLLEEIIIATNPTMTGEATAGYISMMLAHTSIRITRLASGLPVGGDLEIADEVTLGRALQGRQEIS